MNACSDKTRINIRVFKKAQQVLQPQDSASSPVNLVLSQLSVFDQRDDGALKEVIGEIVELHVDARIYGLPDRVFRRARDVMSGLEEPDRSKIRNDDAIESPFVAQNISEEPFVGSAWYAVEFGVGGHGPHCSAELERLFKDNKVVLPDG